jgi:electron transport complex protein RnfB
MPVVNKDECVRCGGCISGYDGSGGCPQKAITIESDGARIDPEKCSNCGQCVQVCGLGAIE